MSRMYYYLAASFPMLDYGVKPPVSYDDFLEDCRRLMPDEDFLHLESAVLGAEPVTSPGRSALSAWDRFNSDLRNEMARFRAQRAHKDPQDFMRGEAYAHPRHAEAVQHAAQEENLLEAEKALDRHKWQFLDDLSGGHFFDMDYLIVYALKLQILERHRLIGSDRGRETLERYKATRHQTKEQPEK